MSEFYIGAIAFLVVSLIVLVFIAFKIAKQKSHIENLRKNLEELKRINEELNSQKELLRQELSKAKSEIARLDTLLDVKEKEFFEKTKLLEESKENLKNELKNIAYEIVKNAKDEISNESKRSIGEVITPLKSDIDEFKTSLKHLYESELKSLGFLQNELLNLKELNKNLAKEAENLAKAFSSDKKAQGIWGEMILSKILELSGLREGIEYKKEVAFGTKRPDVIVYLPQNRTVIIDAKTSFNAYKKYIDTGDEKYLKEQVKAIKSRIEELSVRDYENIEELNTLDFVFLFVPVEAALNAAIEYDDSLFEFAYKKRVILVTPSTLLTALRAIENSWRSERQIKNLKNAVKKADDIYTKAVNFIEEFEKIEKNIHTLQKTYDSANIKLRGNQGLLYQLERFKKIMDLKPKKELD
ncbi:DNA recombination protein RmuC [Caminibacter pacificus]